MTRSLAITAKKSPGDAFPCLANEVLNNLSLPSNFHRYFSLPMAHLTNISAVYLHKSSENLREKILYIFPTFSHSTTIRRKRTSPNFRNKSTIPQTFAYASSREGNKPLENLREGIRNYYYDYRKIMHNHNKSREEASYYSATSLLIFTSGIPQDSCKCRLPQHNLERDVPTPKTADVNTYITLIRKMKH